jgi:hypothetical protein
MEHKLINYCCVDDGICIIRAYSWLLVIQVEIEKEAEYSSETSAI